MTQADFQKKLSALFSEFKLRDLIFKNRIFVSPMCQYSAKEGVPQTWHLVHLGSRAVGGAALVMAEATGVSAIGRISPGCTGIWNDQQAAAWAPIAKFIADHGSVPAIQLAHAGRKASTSVPWEGHKWLSPTEGGWRSVGPSPIPFDPKAPVPEELSLQGISGVVTQFEEAARRALKVGFQVVELHMAHGYLFNEFLSPLSNKRTDKYGGGIENRMRFPLEAARAVRAVWPKEWPVFARISSTDWVDGGWQIEDSVVLARALKSAGVDLIDCSSGGNAYSAKINAFNGYQVPFAEKIRHDAEIATGAVGMITTAQQAEEIIASGRADAVFMAREFLRDPYFPYKAAKILGVDVAWPKQYERAK